MEHVKYGVEGRTLTLVKSEFDDVSIRGSSPGCSSLVTLNNPVERKYQGGSDDQEWHKLELKHKEQFIHRSVNSSLKTVEWKEQRLASLF